MVQVATQVVTGAPYTQKKHTYHQNKGCGKVEGGGRKRIESESMLHAVLRSKKQEIVGLLTPNVVVTDFSSFLSSILLCGTRKIILTMKRKGKSGLKLP